MMKLSRMLFDSQALGRGSIRHFSDGDFAIPLNSGGSFSYIDSIRIRRPGCRPARGIGTAAVPRRQRSHTPVTAGQPKQGFWSFLR